MNSKKTCPRCERIVPENKFDESANFCIKYCGKRCVGCKIVKLRDGNFSPKQSRCNPCRNVYEKDRRLAIQMKKMTRIADDEHTTERTDGESMFSNSEVAKNIDDMQEGGEVMTCDPLLENEVAPGGAQSDENINGNYKYTTTSTNSTIATTTTNLNQKKCCSQEEKISITIINVNESKL